MRILRDHLLREFFTLFALCLAGLLLVFLLGRGLVQMADLIFNKDLDPWLVVRLLVLSLPFLLSFVVPMAILVTTLMTFNRLSFDNEILAIRASGIGLGRLLRPLFLGVAILSLASFLTSDRLGSATHYAYRLLLTRIGIENPAAVLEEGVFIKKFKNFVIFIYEIHRNELKGIRIYQPQEGKPTRTIVAKSGELVSVPGANVILLRLRDGISDEPDPKDPAKLYKLNFRSYDLPLNLAKVRQELPEKKPKDMSVRELSDEIRRLGQDGIRATYPLSAEIHNKIALALASLVFFVVGVPLGITTRRSERSISFAIAFGLMVAYWSLILAGKALAQKGVLPPLPALQFANLVIGGVGLALLGRLARS